jgi:VDE lipocalin domain
LTLLTRRSSHPPWAHQSTKEQESETVRPRFSFRRVLLHAIVWSTIAISPLPGPFTSMPDLLAGVAPPYSIVAPYPRRLAAHAAGDDDAASGMVCVASKCGSVLQECVKDSTCLRGLGCFVACAANPTSATSGGPVGEGACQVRCVDLYECDKLNAFTKCTLTENSCYPALAADPRYPPLPRQLADTVDATRLRRLLNGRWYVSAGLNPAFDQFACQVHDFAAVAATASSDKPSGVDKTVAPIADATFSYRIALDAKGRGHLTRIGQKRLYLKKDRGEETQASFRAGRAWGRDAFDGSSPSTRPPTRTPNSEHPEPQLALTTVPDYMDYEDEWTILSASNVAGDHDHQHYRSSGSGTATAATPSPKYRGREATTSRSEPSPTPSTDYMVVAYRGRNSAWLGYGGLSVYTRRPVNLPELIASGSSNPGDEALLRGIQRGLDKAGLTVADLLPVDHDGC